MANIRRIAVMTSGGDSPGINAAIRAVVRTGISYGLDVFGIRHAYQGLVNGDIERLDSRDVGGIIGRGGTILQTARMPEFKEESYQRQAIRRLNEHGIDGLVVIGGDGSLTGALALHRRGVRVVGIPASIDNDIWGTASSIGVDTAVNTIIEAIDRLRDTASSHERVFLVEVMGRNCGYLAMNAGIITGAEVVLIPEKETTMEELGRSVEEAYMKGKSHAMVIVSEGANLDIGEIADYLNQHDIGFEVRTTILGHVQRGGRPVAFDRMLATRFGVAAVEVLMRGESGLMVALEGSEIVTRKLEEVIGKKRPINPHHIQLAELLSR
ncbi:MAG TPA: 6-phosphofructokinase [Aggregatilineales bacterium]|nr:6-phosphofructokinase [Aggregatilineales bacterium]HQA69817.1 6-phosphofructokinase [Aggregatilineales bacterium]HQE17364.1 6-phosphofructokinase [Aggregatilineales bacterium]